MHADRSLARPIPGLAGLERELVQAWWSDPGDTRPALHESDWLERDSDGFLLPADDDVWDLPLGSARLGIP